MAAEIDVPILPRLLYRYRPVTDDNIDREIAAISESYLWFSKYRNLNDPMEGFYDATRRVQQKSEFEEIAAEILQAKLEVGICCFSDTKRNELMWVHYASNYSGICLGYRPKTLLGALPGGVHAVRLAYGGRPPLVGTGDLADAEAAAVKILSHKKDSWAYEREWRLLGSVGRVKLTSKECVGELYLGSRIQERHKTKLKRKLAHTGIRISQVEVVGYDHTFPK